MITKQQWDELLKAYYDDFDKLPCCDEWKVKHLYKYIRENSCIKTCEIGVFYGKSFLSLAYACKHNDNNGIAIGIDPWKTQEAMQILPSNLESVNIDTAKLDFDNIYKGFLSRLDKYNLNSYCKIMRQKSTDAVLSSDINDIDLLHIDGNHGAEAVMNDFKLYFPKVKSGGIIWFDDYHPIWPTITPTVEYAKLDCTLLEAINAQAIFRKN